MAVTNGDGPEPGPSYSSMLIRACSEIVAELLSAHERGKNVNLNGLIGKTSKKHKLKQMPRLVDVIAAVPPEAKDILLPKLRAKPVRTASGIGEHLPHSVAVGIAERFEQPSWR